MPTHPFLNGENGAVMPKKLFQKGNKAACVNKGKPKFNGRTLALMALDQVLSKVQTCNQLEQALTADLKKDPVGFFKNVVMPLIPKSTLDRLAANEDVERVAQEREDAICDAKRAMCSALKSAGYPELMETLCHALDSVGGVDATTDVTIALGDDDC
jgi:hypothetical protein